MMSVRKNSHWRKEIFSLATTSQKKSKCQKKFSILKLHNVNLIMKFLLGYAQLLFSLKFHRRKTRKEAMNHFIPVMTLNTISRNGKLNEVYEQRNRSGIKMLIRL
jgi:hypothetical protein